MNSYPLTTPQQNIYELQAFYAGTGISNINGIAYMDCQLDKPLMTRIVNRLIASHTAFHIRLAKTPEGPVQRFIAPEPIELGIIDLRDVPEDGWDEALGVYTSAEMELFASPLVEARLVLRSHDWGLLLKFSHLVADGWTATLCIEQSVGAYLAELNGAAVEQSTSDYRDFIESEEAYRQSERYERDREFFLSHYAEPPRALTFRSPTQAASVVARRYSYTVADQSSERIRDYCKAKGASPAVVFEAALFVYLRRFFDTPDIAIGIPVLNRTGAMKKVMGMFVSTVPLVMDVPEEMRVADLVTGLASKHLALFRHQRFPYSDLLTGVRELHGGADRLFDVSFSYQNARAETEDNSRIDAGWIFSGYSENSLSVHVLDLMGTGRFGLYLDYLTDVFSEVEIDFVRRRLLTIVDNLIADDSVSVADIGIMDDDEYRLVTETFNDTKVEYDDTLTVVDLFERAVERWPDRTALVFEGKRWTYRELNNAAKQVAARLQELGVRRGDTVGVLTERSDSTVIAMLGICKAGAGYMPLDVEYPLDRITYLLEESECKVIVSLGSGHELGPGYTEWKLDGVRFDPDHGPELEVEITPRDTYCVLHTSGSTGHPKGVRLSHGALVNLYSTQARMLHGADSFVSLTAQTFDVFRLETEFPMIHGRCCILPSDAEMQSFRRLEALFRQCRAPMTASVPAKMAYYLANAHELASYRHVVRYLIGGEVFTRALADLIQQTSPDAEVFNIYAPAECTVFGVAHRVGMGPIRLGRPQPNYTVTLRDRLGRPVPVGFVGDLHMSGPGVGLGYVDPESPFSDRFTNTQPFRTYRSGDHARWHVDGEIEFIGRIDGQVKMRGLRIELQEVEEQILRHSEAEYVKVVMVEDDSRQFLCAYIACRSPLDMQCLTTALRTVLPRYMVPASYVVLDELPLSPNGKVDTGRLPSPPAETHRTAEDDPINQGNDLEVAIHRAFAEVLGIEDVPATVSFFDLGGDSLSAIRLLNLVSEFAGEQLLVRDLFEHSSIRGLAARLSGSQSSAVATDVELAPIVASGLAHGTSVLLTGASGYLGAHILEELLRMTGVHVILVVRDRWHLDGALKHYFGGADLCDSRRVTVYEGDLVRPMFGLSEGDYDRLRTEVGSIVHCAANVRHYGSLADFRPINVDATLALLEMAAEHGMEFNHVSTISVSGLGMVTQERERIIFDESSFDVGQHHWENVYVHTKYLVEKAVRSYAAKGLRARILRMGNIGARRADGVFQLNAEENAFRSRIAALAKIGVINSQLAAVPVEVSPVDVCARAAVELCSKGDHGTYHIYDPAFVSTRKYLETLGHIVRVVGDDVFSECAECQSHDPDVRRLGLFLRDLQERHVPIGSITDGSHRLENDKTTEILRELGVSWS